MAHLISPQVSKILFVIAISPAVYNRTEFTRRPFARQEY